MPGKRSLEQSTKDGLGLKLVPTPGCGTLEKSLRFFAPCLRFLVYKTVEGW